jgi:hypothetical protein
MRLCSHRWHTDAHALLCTLRCPVYTTSTPAMVTPGSCRSDAVPDTSHLAILGPRWLSHTQQHTQHVICEGLSLNIQ